MLKKLSKIFIMLLSISLLISIAGCSDKSVKEKESSNTNRNSEKLALEFWYYWDGNNGKAIEEIVEKFNADNEKIEIKPIYVPYGELVTKLQASITSNTMPGIAAVDIADMAKFRATGALLELDEYISKNNVNINNFYPQLLEYGRENGKLYSLPVSTNNLALFYNKDIFKQAGLDPNSPPKTWDELRKYCEQIHTELPDVYGFEIYTQVGDSGEGLTWQLQPFLWQAGSEFISNKKAAFNNKEGEKALSFVTGLIKDGLAPVGSWDNFAKGKSAMVVDGSWMVGIWRESLNFEFGTAMLPIPSNGKNATNMGGEQIFAFNKSKEENDAAAEFIMYMTDPETQVQWDIKTGFMPIRKEIEESKEYIDWVNATEPRLLPFIKQQKYAHARPSIKEYPAASLAFAKEIEKAYHGKIDIKEALNNAEKAVNSALER